MNHSELQAAAQQPTRQIICSAGSDWGYYFVIEWRMHLTAAATTAAAAAAAAVAWWRPLLMLLLQPLTACWKVVLEMLGCLLPGPVIMMWLIIVAAIRMNCLRHKEKPFSAFFLLMMFLLPFWLYPL